MRILVDILHPKHVHTFRPLIADWKASGREVVVTTRDKDITHELLDRYGIEYQILSRQAKGFRSVFELVVRWYRMIGVLRRVRPDLAVSVGGVSTALPARLLRIPNIALTDTEAAGMGNRISFPFASRVLTPEWYRDDHGRRHHRYRGLHEWTYLNPAQFSPDPEVLKALGIDPDEPYAVVRLVEWAAAHDRGQRGIDELEATRLVELLSHRYRVILSTEREPPPALRDLVADAPVEAMHQVLAHGSLFVGESPSMAAEASVLGVPAVLVSSWAGGCGNMQVLEQHGLMHVFEAFAPAAELIERFVDEPPSGSGVQELRDRFVSSFEDLGAVLEQEIRELVTT